MALNGPDDLLVLQMNRSDGGDQGDQGDRGCYVFLTYYCAHNGLSLGPSLYFVIRSHSRTDYDSYTSDS
jgi:hypothetical protein